MTPDLSKVSDGELAKLSQEDSMAAFEELVSRYEQRIYRFVANLCGSMNDAQELTQDVFVTAYKSRAQFHVNRSFAAWLFTIARRKCIDHFRSKGPVANEPLPELVDEDDPGKAMSAKERRENLWLHARRHLSPAQYEALWLRYAEALSVAEIALVTRRTQTHVKVILFRARGALLQVISPEGESITPSRLGVGLAKPGICV